MQLDEVKKCFEEQGEFIFRTNRFHQDNISDNSSASACESSFAFQNSFLNMLKDPATKEQIDEKSEAKAPAKIIHFPRKISIPAAAAIFIAVGLFFLFHNITSAVAIGRVYEAVSKITNVCVLKYEPGKAEPIRKVWTSRTLNAQLFQMQSQFGLLDLTNEIEISKSLATALITTLPIAKE